MSLRMMNYHNPISRNVSERQIWGTSYVHCNVYQFLRVRIPMDDNYWESFVPEATRQETVSVQIPTINLLTGSLDSMPCLVCNSSLLSERTIPEALHVILNRDYYSMATRLARHQWPLLNAQDSGMSIHMRLEDTRTVSYEGYEDILRRAVEESMESEMSKPAIESSVESLEKMKFCGPEDEKCSICLEEFNVGDELCRLPCSHFYHEDCIVPWLEKSHTCPLCRFPLPRHQD
ncbi:uncharacterized RING finger protein C2A9.04c-like [Mangifera indica]|uniref:uncharacterized RING finger protein C2A9.04c-like n=1 Tax=Mangifera indica TaxID=29780 RepID=UPI001CF99746|nr:uncharacterized RING finger protein C2A9.04c-like [Mangifera indica]